MSEEFTNLIETVNTIKKEIETRSNIFKNFGSEAASHIEFMDLILNDCDKLLLEINQTIESTSGLKGIFGGKKKKLKLLEEKIEKCKANILENESRLLNFYLNYIIDLEEKYRDILNKYALLREEMRKKKIVWQSVSDAMNRLIIIRDSFAPLKDRIFYLLDLDELDTSSFLEITNVLLELKNGLKELEEKNTELEKKVGFRNIVLAKINTAITKNEDISEDLLDKLGLNIVDFFDKIFEETVSESTSDKYLEDIMPLLDSISDSANNLAELIISYEEAGLPLDVIVNQPDIKDALNLLKLIIGQFKNEYREYIEQEMKFTESLKEYSGEIAPILKSINDYLSRLSDKYDPFKKFIHGIMISWFKNSKAKGGWQLIKKRYLTLENFLLNHYPSIHECIGLRFKGISTTTIKGVSMFQDCIPSEYRNEEFIFNTILPGILFVDGVDIIKNSLYSYGQRGWIKRGELKSISDEYIENYLQINTEVTLIKVDSFEIIILPEFLIKKIGGISEDEVFNYFSKYIADKELCKSLSSELVKVLANS
ncbi:MAG: hypothetical protein ACTSQY_05645 [Candidatus Odinarchaeia archaeon]